jgi:hypothetical protein
MSHAKAAPDSGGGKKRGRSLVVPVLAAVAACLLFIANVVLFVGWFRTKHELGSLEKEKTQLASSNRALADAYSLLHNKKVQICNKSPADVTVHWLSVVYEDGGRLKSFDSQRCEDWAPVAVKNGASRMLTLSSTQEGCNWNGSVVFFAMHYSRGETQTYRDAGAWMGFDKDCYTVQ